MQTVFNPLCHCDRSTKSWTVCSFAVPSRKSLKSEQDETTEPHLQVFTMEESLSSKSVLFTHLGCKLAGSDRRNSVLQLLCVFMYFILKKLYKKL
jgi:hypothetical protein